MPPIQRINPQKILLVEGPDEKNVIARFRDHAQMSESAFSIVSFDGYPNLAKQFPRELMASEVICLGVIVDADENVEGRLQSLRDLFRNNRYELPQRLTNEGTIVTRDFSPKVGLWVMPNNQTQGIFETFLGSLVPIDNELWTRARNCVDSIPPALVKFNSNNIDKAYMHTWLAWQEEPGMRLGVALRKSILDKNTAHAQNFITWLKQLFLD